MIRLFEIVHDGFRPAEDRFNGFLGQEVGIPGRILPIGRPREDCKCILRTLFDALTAKDAEAVRDFILVQPEISVSFGFTSFDALIAISTSFRINSQGLCFRI